MKLKDVTEMQSKEKYGMALMLPLMSMNIGQRECNHGLTQTVKMTGNTDLLTQEKNSKKQIPHSPN